MGAVGIRIPDTLNDREFSRIVQRLQTDKPRIQPDIGIKFQNLIRRQRQFRACAVIIVVCEWDDGVQAIVATGQLKDNENVIFQGERRSKPIPQFGVYCGMWSCDNDS